MYVVTVAVASSLLYLLLVEPFYAFCKNSAVGSCFGMVGCHLVLLVRTFVHVLVEVGSVSNHYLRRILVWHHNCRLGKLTSLGVRMVGD